MTIRRMENFINTEWERGLLKDRIKRFVLLSLCALCLKRNSETDQSKKQSIELFRIQNPKTKFEHIN